MTELVIVGYDGSAESEAALHWGVDEACARRLPLMLCHAWRWPYPAEYADRDTKTIVQRMGRNILERGGAVAGDLAPGLEVRTLLVDGPACAGLLTESDEASLIVIGSHDPDAVPIGSTALQLPGRAPGPVIVVRRAGSAERRIVAGADGSPAATRRSASRSGRRSSAGGACRPSTATGTRACPRTCRCTPTWRS
ncbi:universal stress protein [Actinomadura yumaensis]|uniref:universal stress protein n=1 Tax=Actinomadura yumaensis TaxID=111807 RepID=UPI00361A891F